MGISSQTLGALHQWLWPVQTSLGQFSAQCTSNLDFDQGSCVIQIEWTKTICNNCQPMH